ncbi:MAG: glycosyltransferase [Acidocella sp.]|nr:glycosyltransferase [Acidocella sp.]
MPTEKRLAGSPPPLGGYDADIIILCLNRLEDTLEAIGSALAQRGGEFHVTVLDQGSEPETIAAIARAHGGHPRFALHSAGKNLGVAGGRNLAAKLGHAGVIVALDNDATFRDDWVVARALKRFRRSPELGALGFAILTADGTAPDPGAWGYPKALLPRFRGQFDTTTFVGAGHAIRRAAWNAAGGYDSSLFFTWEEYDFCLAAIALGWRIAYDGTLAVLHKSSAEARVQWRGERMAWFVRNRLIIARKWGASRLGLVPRIGAYLLRGRQHGCAPQVWRGVEQAFGANIPAPRRMPDSMRRYISRNETRHRGGLMRQVVGLFS